MVDVVEAMIASGPTHFEAAASTSRLSSTTSGTPSNTMPASRERGGHVLRRHHRDPRDHDSRVCVVQQAEPRQARQRLPDLAQRLGFECCELFGRIAP